MCTNKAIKNMTEAINRIIGTHSPSKTLMSASDVEAVINGAPDPNSIDNASQVEGTDDGEWVWVTGYKGMDKDMRCYGGFRYELDKRYDMPEGVKVEPCSSGFHLCMNLDDVFHYVAIGHGSRFFEVRALVRKKDLEEYGTAQKPEPGYWCIPGDSYTIDKLAAKSIEIIRELTVDEILESTEAADWDPKYKNIWIAEDYGAAQRAMQADELVEECGYSLPFASWLVKNKKYEIAKAMASVEGLSTDMRVYCIMK